MARLLTKSWRVRLPERVERRWRQRFPRHDQEPATPLPGAVSDMGVVSCMSDLPAPSVPASSVLVPALSVSPLDSITYIGLNQPRRPHDGLSRGLFSSFRLPSANSNTRAGWHDQVSQFQPPAPPPSLRAQTDGQKLTERTGPRPSPADYTRLPPTSVGCVAATTKTTSMRPCQCWRAVLDAGKRRPWWLPRSRDGRLELMTGTFQIVRDKADGKGRPLATMSDRTSVPCGRRWP